MTINEVKHKMAVLNLRGWEADACMPSAMSVSLNAHRQSILRTAFIPTNMHLIVHEYECLTDQPVMSTCQKYWATVAGTRPDESYSCPTMIQP